MASPSGADADPQFVMLRTAMREKIFEYLGRKQSLLPEWRRRLPELAKRLEEVLYRKFPNKVVNHDALCEQSASLLADTQNNNADERDRTDRGLPQHQSMVDMAALSGVDQQFVMQRTAMREKIFEYIGRKQSSHEWRKRLPELAKRLEEILHRKFPNKNDYYNMMKGPIEPHLQFAIRTLSSQNQQSQQNLQKARETASSSGSAITPDVNHDDGCEQFASPLADAEQKC